MVSCTVPSRFCGPPGSGNGGYACGLLARQLEGVVECTLRIPVPLDVPLEFKRTKSGGVLRHGDTVVVAADPATIDVTPPPPVSMQVATDAMASSPAMDPSHPFPTCFVCGPQRQVGDGLRIFPSRWNGDVYVASWVPDHEFGDSEHLLQTEFLWSAMDCPTGYASGFPAVGRLVTGRLAVQQLERVRTGAGCVLMSWPVGVEDRRHYSAACLYQEEKLCAVAKATWIRIGD